MILVLIQIFSTLPKIQTKSNIKIKHNIIYNKIFNIIHNKNEEYLLVLDIPKINLIKKVYPFDNKLNNIDKNVEILSSSKIKENNFILAAHSGNNKNAYFNNLHLLKPTDIIYIHYKNYIYKYSVTDIYYINKTGYLKISKNLENKLILITCSRKYNDKQIIVVSNLIKKTIENVK